jgi:DNA-binding response OmpR family regulator
VAKKILIVDDEPDILKSVEFILKKSGYQVLTASDGEEGLSSVKKHMPNLILLDLRLPGKDGAEVCCELKNDEKFKHIPIILFTASTGIRKDDFKHCKHDDFVLKPFQYGELLEKIKQFLR